MQKYILSLFILSSSIFVQAQEFIIPNQYKKLIFAELGGNAGRFSANYDMRMAKGQVDGFGFRLGLSIEKAKGTFHRSSANVFIIPATFNYLLGKKKHFLELGIGANAIIVSGRDAGLMVYSELFGQNYDGLSFVGTTNLGYRYQALENGFSFRATWTPIFGSGKPIYNWAGLSIGYTFW